jgi:hypothetical protein
VSDPPKKGDLPKGQDFAIPLGPAEGGGIRIIRHHSDHSISTGVCRPLEEGKPFQGEVVRMSRNEDGPGIKMESVYKPEAGGPAKVNSPSFKSGWDRIWKKSKGKPN